MTTASARVAAGQAAHAKIEVETETLDHCPNCDGDAIAPWCRTPDRALRVSVQHFVYSRCNACGVLFQSTRPIESEIHHFYPESYGPHVPRRKPPPIGGGPAKSSERHESAAAGRINRRRWPNLASSALIDRPYAELRPGMVLLDFGCGRGEQLDRAKRQGCETIGIDFSERAVAEVRRNGHTALLVTPDLWDAVADETVDLVRMSHVLEHLYEPRPVLAEIVRKMKPGGRLHVSVPNPAGWAAAVFRGAWFGLECPRHIMMYPPRAVRRLLAEFGLDEIEVLHEPAAKDQVRSWSYALGLDGGFGDGTIARLLGKYIFRLAFLPGAWTAALFRHGDRMHVFARK